MPLSRAQKRFLAIERAKRRLQHRLDDIDWEIEELGPQVEELGKLEASRKIREIEPGDLGDGHQE